MALHAVSFALAISDPAVIPGGTYTQSGVVDGGTATLGAGWGVGAVPQTTTLGVDSVLVETGTPTIGLSSPLIRGLGRAG